MKPGARFWFATATYIPGQRNGTMGGSDSTPVIDVHAVPVAYGEGSVAFVDVTPSGSVLTLTVSIDRDADGAYAAAYSRHTATGSMLFVSEYWGTCR